jgi:hypothetical protein
MIGDVTDPRSELLADPVLEYGDRVAADAGLILRSTVGSGVHGIAIAGTDDHDEMAVFVEPAAWVLGLDPHRDSRRGRGRGRATPTWSPTPCGSTCGSR